MLLTFEKDISQQLQRMHDMDSAVRRDAIESLRGIKDGRVLYPLIKALQEENQGIQQAAMDALMAFEDESAVYNVLPLLLDRRVYVRNMAREILDKIGGYGIGLFSPHIKDKDEDFRKMIADILGRINSPEARRLLIEMLRDPCSNIRSAAAEGLGNIGDSSAVEPLIDLLDDEEWVAFFAADALGRIGDKRAIRHLKRLIDSSNVDLQTGAIEAISHIGGDEAVDSLLEALDYVKPEVINMVIKGIVRLTHGSVERVIERFGRDRLLEYLIEAMGDVNMDDVDVKRDFVQAFSIIGNPRGSSYILKLISDVEMDDQDIAQIAVEALKNFGDEETLIETLKDKDNTCVMIAIRVLGVIKSIKAVPDLFTLFENADRDIKIEVLHTLGKIEGRDSLRFLIDMLSYGEGHIRGAAAHSLGIMTAPEAIEPLLNALQWEEYQDVVGEIISSIVEIGQRNNIPSLFEGLISNLSNKKSYVRETVVKGLGMLGDVKATEYLTGMLNDESWRVRKACIETLSHLNAKGLLDVLVTAASDEKDEVRMLVAQLTGRYQEDKAVDILIFLLSDRNNWIINKAIEGVVKLKGEKAIPYLMELACSGEPFIQKSSICALGELNAPEAGKIVKDALYHKDPEIRDAAIEACRKLGIVNDVNI